MSKPIDQEGDPLASKLNSITESLLETANAGLKNALGQIETLRTENSRLVAQLNQARAAVQPAGVVVAEGWKLVEKTTCYVLMDGNRVVASLAGPSADDDARIIANMLAAAPHPVSGEQRPDMADAYVGAMEDRNIWKRRALEAEAKIRTYDQRIVDLGVLSMRTALEKPAAQDVAGLAGALEQARLFIRNGIELGYISMPDPVHETLQISDEALAAHRAQQGEQP